jgi:hypothetical protein
MKRKIFGAAPAAGRHRLPMLVTPAGADGFVR